MLVDRIRNLLLDRHRYRYLPLYKHNFLVWFIPILSGPFASRKSSPRIWRVSKIDSARSCTKASTSHILRNESGFAPSWICAPIARIFLWLFFIFQRFVSVIIIILLFFFPRIFPDIRIELADNLGFRSNISIVEGLLHCPLGCPFGCSFHGELGGPFEFLPATSRWCKSDTKTQKCYKTLPLFKEIRRYIEL